MPLILCALIFIHEWRDLQFKVDSEFFKNFSSQIYLLSEILPDLGCETDGYGRFYQVLEARDIPHLLGSTRYTALSSCSDEPTIYSFT